MKENPQSSENNSQDVAESWTVRRILDWTTAHLTKHGSDSPRLDAEVLLAFARKCERIRLYTNYEDEVSPVERTLMRELVQRRAKSEPVAYLVSNREFFGLDFYVDQNVLVPRPDTETLVMELVDVAQKEASPDILDLCTGSGCIAIAAATHCPQASFLATDISTAALRISQKNAETNGQSQRIRFLQSDYFEGISKGSVFDIIVSNPPYIPDAEIESLDADVCQHEPRLALAGGTDGLDYYRRIIQEADSYLKEGGSLLLEFSPEQESSLKQLFEASGKYAEIRVKADLAGRSRVIIGQKLPILK
ncbi:peptide chain release factor N(5)-glutamine methyltransferase [uncultured Gimesia sp.]|uniref:peptide chain release factor N(5)-glutamine methyltransferase n=1 Tax=uncultured Gimesia sp. TaxID=1678688 RepID=UPI00262B5471|nr:peptide chain release factor N(5)-glutamine methyltransferase [uncultured Gimesia sp.]